MRLDAFRLIPSRAAGPIGVKWDDSTPSNGSTEAARVTPSSMRGPAFESRWRQGFYSLAISPHASTFWSPSVVVKYENANVMRCALLPKLKFCSARGEGYPIRISSSRVLMGEKKKEESQNCALLERERERARELVNGN